MKMLQPASFSMSRRHRDITGSALVGPTKCVDDHLPPLVRHSGFKTPAIRSLISSQAAIPLLASLVFFGAL